MFIGPKNFSYSILGGWVGMYFQVSGSKGLPWDNSSFTNKDAP